MPLKFAANISWLFKSHGGLAARYAAAKSAGFRAVEINWPYEVPSDDLVEAQKATGLETVLLNGWPGNLEAGELGIASSPTKIREFKETLELTVTYANALNCKRVLIPVGKHNPVYKDAALEEVLLENLAYAADRFAKENITVLIEPLNTTRSVPGYFLVHNKQAIDYIKKINKPNIKLQLDFYHAQLIDGNLTALIQDYLPHIGHIQISQVPDRHEPDTEGEIYYPYIFKVLTESGYDGWIGLEYNPKGKTEDGLGWMKQWQ